MKLYSYFRSSASFRVRIALALKGLAFDYVPVHLARGEQRAPAYGALAPAGLVPLLEIDDGARIGQSLAIIEYLDETHPAPPLLPPDALGRACVRALSQDIACDLHPLDNLRVLRYLVHDLGVDEAQKNAWYRHWVAVGLAAFERSLAARPAAGQGAFCWGDAPTLADCCLVPQIFNAERFDCDLASYPLAMAVHRRCMALDAFQRAHPSACPDAEA